MQIPFVDLKRQYARIKIEIDQAIQNVINDTAFIGGSYTNSFESAFADYCSANYCIGVGNGTDALVVALKILGIGKGDEVITAANSFIATSEAVTLSGAKVIFADINPRTYNIDVNQVEKLINERTKAIIPVHIYGQPAEMNQFLDIAQKHKVFLIEDAAQAHGAEYRGMRIGSIGDMACFSFYPGKNLGAYGDAGAIVTNNEEYALKARMIANHGRIEKYSHEMEGMNSRLDGIQSAILSVKLKHLDDWTTQRIQAASLYKHHLENTDLILPSIIDDAKAVYHLYVVRTKKESRNSLITHLKNKGIGVGIHYPIALPNLNAYQYMGLHKHEFPAATRASQEILSLPIFPEIKESEVGYIANSIKQYFS